MIPTPNWLAELLERRRTPTEPKPAGPEIPLNQWTPRPEATFTEIDIHREAVILDQLAAKTADTDPWTAALDLFGGRS